MAGVLSGVQLKRSANALRGDLLFIGRGRHLGDIGALGVGCQLLAPLCKLFLVHAELGNRRIGFEEPFLDGRITLAEAVALGVPDHRVQRLEIDLGVLRVVRLNVPAHVVVGQTSVAVLLRVRLELTNHDAEVRIVRADRVQRLVLRGARSECLLLKGRADRNRAIIEVHKNRFHCNCLLSLIKQPACPQCLFSSSPESYQFWSGSQRIRGTRSRTTCAAHRQRRRQRTPSCCHRHQVRTAC